MNKNIPLLLTNSSCGRCRSMASYLRSKNIKVKIVDISSYLKEIQELNLRRLPIFKLGNEFIQYTTAEETIAKVIGYATLE